MTKAQINFLKELDSIIGEEELRLFRDFLLLEIEAKKLLSSTIEISNRYEPIIPYPTQEKLVEKHYRKIANDLVTEIIELQRQSDNITTTYHDNSDLHD